MERMAARVFCAVLLCLAGCWSSTDATGLNRTGVCPSPLFGAVECTWRKFVSCVDDRECANNQKCCNNGCGLQCMDTVTENLGVCPMMTNAEFVRCARNVAELCADDSECPKNQKCCSVPCGGTRCIGPVTAVKPGVCPKTKAELVRCIRKDDELCADDSDCPKNQKCCGTACGGTRCTAPVTAAKPGVCPKTNGNEEIRCVRKDDELCADDSECPKNEKCCGTACGGTRCTAPVTVKPGVCPKINEEIMCIRKDDKLCASDNECPKNQKCCGTPCGGTRCTAPVTVKPGVCPSRKYEPAECALIKFVSCADDRECANNEKCCSNGCGRQCMAPVTDVCGLPLVSGNCLAYMPMWGFNSAAGKCVSFVYGGCQGNGNRFDSQEECEESCVRSAACKLPLEVGPCKAYMPMWGFDSAVGKCVRFVYGGCQGNDNRFNTQKECEESCGVRNVNPGVCPRRKYKPAMCARVTFMPCVDDGDCASNEKCCSNGCGLQCMAAVTAKPGFCPAKKYKPPMCVPSCADDRDCANKQKCCNNGCGLQCVDPVKVKPGVCPVRKPKPWMCPLMNFMSCVDDNDCVNNEKCCSNGCGLDCVPPVTGLVPN